MDSRVARLVALAESAIRLALEELGMAGLSRLPPLLSAVARLRRLQAALRLAGRLFGHARR